MQLEEAPNLFALPRNLAIKVNPSCLIVLLLYVVLVISEKDSVIFLFFPSSTLNLTPKVSLFKGSENRR